MEKEQKKLLLVAVSVGVFLLVTITVALILLTPKTQPQGNPGYAGPPLYPAGNIQSVENNTPVIKETNNNIDSGNSEVAGISDADEKNLQISIDSSKLNAAGVPDISEAKPDTVAVAPRPAAEPVKPAAQSTSAPAPAPAPERSTTASAPAAPARPAASSRAVTDFWIQTGSFNAKVRADDAKELLESKGFISIIENREINGRTWYRVRLGPYTSETEANYWLSLVQSIEGFGESQVWQSTRQQ